MAAFTTLDLLNLRPSFTAMMNIDPNRNELHSFNPASRDDPISLSHDPHELSHQLPAFSFSDELQNATLNYDSFFPPGSINLINADCVVNSSDPQLSQTHGLVGNNKAANIHGGKKRKRSHTNREAALEKPREVVHVRAKRGQATDSHSLAERLRREKINEKLRCLQDLVPGCYKTMGMAVMLDVIINYVRSLQNQIDFLSMKLSAASLFYDFNSSDMDAIGTLQGTNGFEAQGMEKMMGEGYGMLPQFHPSWPL